MKRSELRGKHSHEAPVVTSEKIQYEVGESLQQPRGGRNIRHSGLHGV
jgi:hypothetical protein